MKYLLLWCIALTIISILTMNVFLWHQKHDWIENADKYENTNNYLHLDRFKTTINNKLKFISKLQHYKIHLPIEYKDSFEKPWFMNNGTIKASNNYLFELALWPQEISNGSQSPMDDRIVNQLMYIPKNYDENNFVPKGNLPLKKILLAYGQHGWNDLNLGRKKFLEDNCPVNACFIMADPNLIEKADAVIFKDRFVWPKKDRPSNQLWILFLLESPFNTQVFSLPPNVINWTATYRHDSDIVAPYEKFVSYDDIFPNNSNIRMISDDTKTSHNNAIKKNYALGKTKKVAWFVSNCGAKNKRLEYARELSRFIEVDIYGSCGKHKCPRTKAKECFQILNRDYKFYLAFENSNCRDYITEKFFVNGLGHNFNDLNVVPIVMGAHSEDYVRAAPRNSYIYIGDFESPSHLANYLNQLDQDDAAYNRFFEWKTNTRKGEFINTYFWCRICALLHASPDRQKKIPSYENIAQWWAPKNICLESNYRWHVDKINNSIQ